jgi:hypothetical protein
MAVWAPLCLPSLYVIHPSFRTKYNPLRGSPILAFHLPDFSRCRADKMESPLASSVYHLVKLSAARTPLSRARKSSLTFPPARSAQLCLGGQSSWPVAGTMLPDILPYDPTCPASFPKNGRALTDDAADAFLSILTNGKVTRDKVGPHGDLLAEFPYLGPPHNG